MVVVQCLNSLIVQWYAVPLHLSYFSRFLDKGSIMISVA